MLHLWKTLQATNKWWLLTIQFRDNIYGIHIDLWGGPVRCVPPMLTCGEMRAKQWMLSGCMLRDRHLHRSTELNIYSLLLTNTVAHLSHSCPKDGRQRKPSTGPENSFQVRYPPQRLDITFALLNYQKKTKLQYRYKRHSLITIGYSFQISIMILFLHYFYN